MKRNILTSVIILISLACAVPTPGKAQDVTAYWDYTISGDGYGDFWTLTEGDGFDDSCGGTVGYYAQSDLVDPSNSDIDGGLMSETVLTTIAGSARSDVAVTLVQGDYTLNTHGYAYQCGCSLCMKIFDWVDHIPIHILPPSVTYYTNGTPVGSSCIYGSTACLGSSQPSCTGGFGIGYGCYTYARVEYLRASVFGLTTCYAAGTFSWPGPGLCN